MPEQNRYGVAIGVYHREIEFAVAVQVDECHRLWICSRGIRYLRAERAIAIAEENRHVVRACVAHDQVKLAVRVEVTDCNLNRTGARRIRRPRLERAVAIAEQDRDRLSHR